MQKRCKKWSIIEIEILMAFTQLINSLIEVSILFVLALNLRKKFHAVKKDCKVCKKIKYKMNDAAPMRKCLSRFLQMPYEV